MNKRDVAEDHRQMVDAYRQHRHDLVRFATVLVGPDAAHDVVSSAVLRVLERDSASAGKPKAYLYQAVANQARNHKRGEARRRSREERAPRTQVEAAPAEPYPEVREAIERLSVRQRAVIYLSYWEDLPEQTVANHLGITTGSVRRHMSRARRHLRRALHDHDR